MSNKAFKRGLSVFLCAGLTWPAAQAFARDPYGFSAQQLGEMSLDEVLNIKTSIASKSPEAVERTPAIVTVVTRQDIEEQGWTSLAELMEQLPDFMVARLPEAESALVVRGMASREGVLVMVNGVALNNPLDGGFAFLDMPLGTVERVEVIRGPGSALYGGSAVLAVVNVITDSSSPTTRNVRLGASYATENSFRVQAHYDEPLTLQRAQQA